MTPLLRLDGVSKSFHGNPVVVDVSFEVASGEVVALLGENGAGKSTVIKMLAGVHTKDSGTVTLAGKELIPGRGNGISFVHQDLGLIEWMTVAENIALGTGFPRRRGLVDWKAVREWAGKILEPVGGGIDPDDRVFDLPRTERSLLAIARALVGGPRLLVLDEPTASLPSASVRRLFEVLDRLRDSGVGMIYVSHRLDEIYQLADSLVVMRNGKVAGAGRVDTIPPAELVRLIVGRDVEPSTLDEPGEAERLTLRGVRVGDVGPVDLTVRAGEVVGLVGLRGAGQEEVGRAVAGVVPISQGSMSIDGSTFVPKDTSAAVRAGVGFVTSNREVDGVAAGLTVRENLFLNPRLWGRKLLARAERDDAAAVIGDFGVCPADQEAPMETLSGGNQQKVIIARWFGLGRAIVTLEEPTMGVDVGAKADIYALLRRACRAGTAVLVVSTDLEEVAGICHRALVFRHGSVTGELTGDDLTMSGLISAVSGL